MRNIFLDNRAYRHSIVDESFTFQPRVMVYKTLYDPRFMVSVDVVTAVVIETSGGVAALALQKSLFSKVLSCILMDRACIC